MDWSVLLVVVLTLPSGILMAGKVIRCCIWDYKIRKNGTACIGTLSAAQTADKKEKYAMQPVIKLNGVEQELHSVRAIHWSGRHDESQYGKAIQIVYSKEYPTRCTHGRVISLLLEAIIFLPVGIFLTLVGFEGIRQLLF